MTPTEKIEIAILIAIDIATVFAIVWAIRTIKKFNNENRNKIL